MSHGAIINAKIRPMTTPEATATAIAWQNGVILAVGSDDEIQRLAGRHSLPITDLQGTTLVPGFVDAHTHFVHVGVKRLRPDLAGASSRRECLQRVQDWLQENPGTGPVVAEGFDEDDWDEDRRHPSMAELDELARVDADGHPDPRGTPRPLVFRRICGHVAIANTPALAVVRKQWPDDRLAHPTTGRLEEDASLYLNEVFPSTPDQLQRAIQTACSTAHSLGVTSVGDYSQAPYRAALQQAAFDGTLTVRVASSIYPGQLDDEIQRGFQTARPGAGPKDDARIWEAMGAGDWTEAHQGVDPDPRDGGSSEWLQDSGLKIFLDGSLGARTAWLRDPYSDEPNNVGLPNWTDEEVLDMSTKAHAAGIQLHIHAIGDRAIDQALQTYTALEQGQLGTRPSVADVDADTADANTPLWQRDLRHRIEHDEILTDDQIPLHARLGIVASSQPNFVGEWSAKGGMYEERLGERVTLNNRFVTMKKAGIRLAFGSDGMPFGAPTGLLSAMNHPVKEERLSIWEAIWHYTNEAAWSLHMEPTESRPGCGVLTPGAWADMVAIVTDATEDPTDLIEHPDTPRQSDTTAQTADSPSNHIDVIATWVHGTKRFEHGSPSSPP